MNAMALTSLTDKYPSVFLPALRQVLYQLCTWRQVWEENFIRMNTQLSPVWLVNQLNFSGYYVYRHASSYNGCQDDPLLTLASCSSIIPQCFCAGQLNLRMLRLTKLPSGYQRSNIVIFL